MSKVRPYSAAINARPAGSYGPYADTISIGGHSSGTLGSILQASENIRIASSIKQDAASAIDSILDHLSEIKSNILKVLNGDRLQNQELSAYQSSVDRAINAVAEEVNKYSLEQNSLFSGRFSFNINEIPEKLGNFILTSLRTGRDMPLSIYLNVSSTPEQASVGTIAPLQESDSTVRITGILGSEEISFKKGMNTGEVEDIINASVKKTGVAAEDGRIKSITPGSGAFVMIEDISGKMSHVLEGTYSGADAEGSMEDAMSLSGSPSLSVSETPTNAYASFEEPGTPGIFGITVNGGGIIFKLGSENDSSFRVYSGITSLLPETIGYSNSGNTLSTLSSSSSNSLTSDPLTAFKIIEESIRAAEAVAGQIDSVMDYVIDESFSASNKAFDELINERSSLRNGSIAKEIALKTTELVTRNADFNPLYGMSLSSGAVLRLLND